jgi:hypothetical protein
MNACNALRFRRPPDRSLVLSRQTRQTPEGRSGTRSVNNRSTRRADLLGRIACYDCMLAVLTRSASEIFPESYFTHRSLVAG